MGAMYSDDILSLSENSTLEAVNGKMNKNLQVLNDWCRVNLLITDLLKLHRQNYAASDICAWDVAGS